MSAPVLDIVCLCAAWCGTCREYTAAFEQLQAALPGHSYRWIDIEDEAERVGDVDVETFPTLLVAHGGQPWFAGPVLPRAIDAQRLIESLLSAGPGLTRSAADLGLPEDQFAAFKALAATLAVAD
jgi:thioredoxin 1